MKKTYSYFFIIHILFMYSGFVYSQWINKYVQPLTTPLTSVYFIDSFRGFTCGKNLIYGCTPWGISNPVIQAFDINTVFKSINFSDTLNGFAVGVNSFFKSGIIVSTTDGGVNWTDENKILGYSELYDVCFVNNLTGWTTGHNIYGNHTIIGKSTDGGISWTIENIPYIKSGILYAIYFVDENNGWAAGRGDNQGFGKLLKTTDGGNTWLNVSNSISGVIKDVYFSDKNVGFICTDAGEILESTDSGYNWITQYSANVSVNAISFVDKNFGWAVGDNGLIINTTNGGSDWIKENSNTTSNLKSIFSNYYNVAWICGDDGNLLIRTTFTPLTSLTPIDGANAWGDYNSDGYLDIALTGVTVTKNKETLQQIPDFSEIYRNNGDGTFTKILDQLIKVSDGSIEWGDYDNDGDLDLLLSGYFEDDTSGTYIARIYRNDGNDIFTEIPSHLNGFARGFLKWGDMDNDGDLDIVSSAGVYRNDGNGVFTEVTTIFTGLHFSTGMLGDMDNDGDLDIIAGLENNTPKIFSNQGGFHFTAILLPAPVKEKYFDFNQLTEEANTKYNLFFERFGSSAYYGSCDIGDYDSDGDLDILWINTGYNSSTTTIYRNDGNNVFEEPTMIKLPDLVFGTGAFGDYDNDGDLDIFLTGGNTYNDLASGLYRNEGNNIFIHQPFYYSAMDVISWASASWADFDNDGDLDILVNGEAPYSNGRTIVYRNNYIYKNYLPSSPQNLKSIINGQAVTLSWDKSTDKETFQDGLNYNIIVGTEPWTPDIISPMSDLSNGYRRIVNQGNTNHNTSWTIKNLEPGIYYWSVQAIDNNFAGSGFSCSQVFTTIPTSAEETETLPAGIPDSYKLDQNYPNPFNPSTKIRIAVPRATHLNLSVYNVLGQLVANLVNEDKNAGYFEYDFNGSNLASGIYLYRIEAGEFIQTKKMILSK